MNKSKCKRWQWWFCVISLSPLITLVFGLGLVGSIFYFIGDMLNFMDHISPPKFLVKYVNWANGK